MIAARIAAAGRSAAFAASYVAPALFLGWFVGGQAAAGRIDAILALPLLMPGALIFARLVRDEAPQRRSWLAGLALCLLAAAQLALHLVLAGRAGLLPLLVTLLAGWVCWRLAEYAERRTRTWRRWFRWPLFVLAAAGWFAVGQLLLFGYYQDRGAGDRKDVVMLTGLPLRWSGGGDFQQMLAEGPADRSALAAIEQRTNLRLADSLADGVPPGATLFLAHPRALSAADLVRIDAHVRSGGDAVILADALSNWPPPHPLGDPRNPPVTSLLTPLLDHWGVELAAPGGKAAGDVELFIDPAGYRLRLHSAGRFVRLPPTCRPYGAALVARCTIGRGTVWLVGDADMLHESLWASPVAGAPWLERSDNIAWLVGRLRGENASSRPATLWIRPRRN